LDYFTTKETQNQKGPLFDTLWIATAEKTKEEPTKTATSRPQKAYSSQHYPSFHNIMLLDNLINVNLVAISTISFHYLKCSR